MGLDMYLTKKTYVKNWDHNPKEKHFDITVKQNDQEVSFIKKNRINIIEEEIGYWRKANHIHKWFVDNVQNGVDECQIAYVDHSKLVKLLEICKKVKEDHSLAKELLPTQSGFFFGGTEYDEYYFQDIDNTIKILEEELSSKDEKGYYTGDVYYRSSW